MRQVAGGLLCLVLFILAATFAWVFNIAGYVKALDALVNVCLFGGQQGETTSSHTGRWLQSGHPVPFKFRAVAWFCELWEDNHCINHIQDPYLGKPL